MYVTVALVCLSAFASLAVDLGRVQVAKTQLRRAADAAARYGALSLSGGNDNAAAVAAAATAGADNVVDGTPLVLNAGDVEVGTWSNGGFSAGGPSPNAVRVTAVRSAQRNTAVPLMFAQIVGQKTCDLSAVSVATYTPPQTITTTTPATANPFLAGMPDGTVANPVNPHNNPDHAPANSPVQVAGLPMSAGGALTFDQIAGSAANDPNQNVFTADGNVTAVVDNIAGSENGMSDLYAPINALVGVFLDDSQPDQTPAPPVLDFSTPASRDFTVLQPQLKQVFFIGDGRTSGGAVQQFVIPPGATRFYVATMDAYEWNNNHGSYTTTIHLKPFVTTVK